ncbi:SMP-30/gluconolactonase/LRE family protein [Brevundimonas sp.]|uniref:SMP-30/gluconolactonase/LRE family protein n=1 Tax=Brevundimonas sp. TaxID=1871086 RepID=UPI00286B222F|nr:SMP-30/gluconolactonase/LRE family protein [Brevundimonas sp.]
MITGPVEVVKVDNALGESIVWDSRCNSFWWTDTRQAVVLRLDWSTREVTRYPTGRPVYSLALTKDPEWLLVAAAREIGLFRPLEGHHVFVAAPDMASGLRLNDGKVDPWGRFVVGELSTAADGPPASVFRLEASGALTRLASGLSAVNGLAFDVGTSTAYVSDSRLGSIWRTPYPRTAQVFQLESPFQTAGSLSRPDGACVDSAGVLWSSQYGDGTLRAFGRDGSSLKAVSLATQHATCCAFGGPDLNWLAVTTASGGQQADAHLHLLKTDRCGHGPALWAGMGV